MARLRIGRDQDRTRLNRRAAKRRKTVVLAVVAVTGACLVLVYQAIRSLVEGDYVMPVMLFLLLAVVLFLGAVTAWQYLHPEPEPKGKKKNREASFPPWPPMNFPPTDGLSC